MLTDHSGLHKLAGRHGWLAWRLRGDSRVGLGSGLCHAVPDALLLNVMRKKEGRFVWMVSYDVMILPPWRVVGMEKKNAMIGQKTRNLRNTTALVREGNKKKEIVHTLVVTLTALPPLLTS